MKSSLILGFIFLIIGGILGYIRYSDSTEPFLTYTLVIGILIGAGLRLLFGAIIGYSSKAQSVKRQQRIKNNDNITVEKTPTDV
ncbi:hypothetical protein [Apibacter adventoris]|uniref:Uncharacterized protein n=1 Tax=Apibacter adventoris TaxID=1679466 RepID=A0A2S8A771_9FLAO|nr:hypothetical protein [Apibacter adventoris]PQL90412.1 hypothetical protein C4S77_10985 [Apibacter adventoris]